MLLLAQSACFDDGIQGIAQLLELNAAALFFEFAIFASTTNRVRKARLVATSFPANKANPKVEKMKIEFAKMKIDYKNIKSGQTDRL